MMSPHLIGGPRDSAGLLPRAAGQTPNAVGKWAVGE